MASARISLALADHDLNHPVIDGQVQFDDLDVDVIWELDDGERAGKMLKEKAFDASEFSMASYLAARARGVGFTAIPVFPNRKFRHSYIFCNASAGIREPRDLEGKRVGLRGWAVTACVWMRGILSHFHGVDLTRVDWFAPGDPRAYTLPHGVRLHELRALEDLDAMLVAGELDAVIYPDILPSFLRGDPAVKRLFDDYKAVEQAFYRDHRIFPISHAVVIKDEVIRDHPHVPMSLLRGFRRARDIAFQRVDEQQILSISWASAQLEEQRALMGPSYWAYNLAPDNRRVLDLFALFCCEQRLVPELPDIASVFAPDTVADPGA